jgi:Xaa-Pro dipeptidase
MTYEITPQIELNNRVLRFQRQLKNSEIASAIITQNTDLFYFSGTIQRSLLYIPSEGEPVLAVSGNLERATEESKLKNIVHLKNNHELDKTISKFGYRLTGFTGLELDVLPASYYFVFQSDYKDCRFVDVSEIIKKVRMIKSEYELTWIRQACKIQDEVMLLAKNTVRPGMSELEIDGLLLGYARKRGHQGFFRCRGYNQEINCCHILSGEESALSTYVKGPLGGKGTTPNIPLGASHNLISENKPVLIDFGVGINGYVSDMTRTYVAGRLPEEMEKAHEVAREIKRFMEGWVKPGKLCSEVYNEIIELVRSRGFGDYFMGFKKNQVAFVGHGLGLELDEYPVIAPNFKEKFQENMVYAFEPKFSFPGKGAVGIEDDFRVTTDGVERLTKFDDALQRLGT